MNKQTGSYYTPKKLSDFMVGYLERKTEGEVASILEPSVGDGIFVESINNRFINDSATVDLTIVDINAEELNKAKKIAKLAKCFNRVTPIKGNFLALDHDKLGKFPLIIGNPPYIKKKSLSTDTIKFCEQCHKRAGLHGKTINNIWTSFVVSCTNLLTDDGIMGLVLPSDLLQVKYAEEIRVYLERMFERLEIFTLDADVFPDIEQQTIVLFAYKKSSERGTFFFKIADYETGEVKKISSNGLMISQSKWTHYNLSPSEIRLLNLLNEQLPRISDFVDVKAGIVTGANTYFILSKDKVKAHGASSYSLPILSKSRFATQGTDFTKAHFRSISEALKPSYLLDLSEKKKINNRLNKYLKYGSDLGIPERYKCSLRYSWFHVPNIGLPPEAFFFKRIHLLPKVIRNVSNVYVTDTAYKINSKNNTDIKSFIQSFYNVITLIYAELMGRKYGGGVLELTPNEFKNLPILYKTTTKENYRNFSKNIVFNSNNQEYLQPLTLKSELNLSEKQISELKNIYSRLLLARTKISHLNERKIINPSPAPSTATPVTPSPTATKPSPTKSTPTPPTKSGSKNNDLCKKMLPIN